MSIWFHVARTTTSNNFLVTSFRVDKLWTIPIYYLSHNSISFIHDPENTTLLHAKSAMIKFPPIIFDVIQLVFCKKNIRSLNLTMQPCI